MKFSIRYINDVNPLLKSEMTLFGKWLRRSYNFPNPFEIRLINQKAITDYDGTECALRWWQNEKGAQSVKCEIAVGSFDSNLKNEGPTVAYPTVAAAMGRSLAYFYQAVFDLPIDEDSATDWGDAVMDAYIEESVPPPFNDLRKLTEA